MERSTGSPLRFAGCGFCGFLSSFLAEVIIHCTTQHDLAAYGIIIVGSYFLALGGEKRMPAMDVGCCITHHYWPSPVTCCLATSWPSTASSPDPSLDPT